MSSDLYVPRVPGGQLPRDNAEGCCYAPTHSSYTNCNPPRSTIPAHYLDADRVCGTSLGADVVLDEFTMLPEALRGLHTA